MVRAVIFDMDGVISDTQGLHAEVEEELLKEYEVAVSAEEITGGYAGVSDREFFETIFQGHGRPPKEIDVIIEEKWDRMMALAENNVQPIPGVIELIRELKGRGFRLGVASASPMKFIALVLSELGLRGEFDAVTSAEEVERGKPDPEVFLLTAERLGVRPEDCVVIEDAINGMVAAKRAGMKCVGLVKKGGEYPADLVVRGFGGLSIARIEGLLSTPH